MMTPTDRLTISLQETSSPSKTFALNVTFSTSSSSSSDDLIIYILVFAVTIGIVISTIIAFIVARCLLVYLNERGQAANA